MTLITAAKSGFDSTASTIGKVSTGIQTAAKTGPSSLTPPIILNNPRI